MNIGLYFGSFNPIHTGHLIIANHVLNLTSLEKIWFIVSPQNPLKDHNSLLSANKRLALAKIAVSGDKRFFVSDIEFHLSKPSYTINTLQYLSEKYSQHEFSIIMGSDSYSTIGKWKNSRSIISGYKIFVYPRPDIKLSIRLRRNIKILEAPLLSISSTEIRELIKSKKSIRYLVPDKVRAEIEKNNYYKK
jgi:nicotinate-nucleotide adenylyltransferase